MSKVLLAALATWAFFVAAIAFSAPANASFVCGVSEDFTDKGIKRTLLNDAVTIGAATGPSGVHWEDKACAYFDRGFQYHRQDNYDAALKNYTSALNIMHDFPQASAALGDLYLDMKQPDSAEAQYRALENYTENAAVQNSICWERALRGRPLDRALVACNLSIAIDPKNTNHLQTRCVLNIQLKNYSAAIADCNASLDNVDDLNFSYRVGAKASALYPKGIAELKVGKTDLANADIAQAKSLVPDIADDAKNWGIGP